MDYQEFKDAISTLDWASYHIEDIYTENEGEVTEETEKMEAEIEALRHLLNTDGVDFLGRWLIISSSLHSSGTVLDTPVLTFVDRNVT